MIKKLLMSLTLLTIGFTINSFSQEKANQQTKLVIKVVNAQQNGAVVPNAKIILKSKNHRFEGNTDDQGKFEVKVPNETYQLTVESHGFGKYIRKTIKFVGAMTLILNADLIPEGIAT